MGQTIDLNGNTATAQVYQTGQAAQVTRYGDHATDPFLERLSRWAEASPRRSPPEGGCGGRSASRSAPGRRCRPTPRNGCPVSRSSSRWRSQAPTHWRRCPARPPPTRSRAWPTTGSSTNRLAIEVERSSRHGRPLSVAVLDLDHFKQVNDTHGHQIGDRVLAELANRLATAVRSGELMARIGGEEFAWLMPEATPEGAHAAAERVRTVDPGHAVRRRGNPDDLDRRVLQRGRRDRGGVRRIRRPGAVLVKAGRPQHHLRVHRASGPRTPDGEANAHDGRASGRAQNVRVVSLPRASASDRSGESVIRYPRSENDSDVWNLISTGPASVAPAGAIAAAATRRPRNGPGQRVRSGSLA